MSGRFWGAGILVGWVAQEGHQAGGSTPPGSDQVHKPGRRGAPLGGAWSQVLPSLPPLDPINNARGGADGCFPPTRSAVVSFGSMLAGREPLEVQSVVILQNAVLCDFYLCSLASHYHGSLQPQRGEGSLGSWVGWA